MSQDFIIGKRLPRGARRSGSISGGGKKLPCSYYDLSKVKQNKTPEEYNQKVAEIKKMGSSFC